MSIYNNKNYFNDNIRAIDARHEAQKIAFTPLAFQVFKLAKARRSLSSINCSLLRCQISSDEM